MKLSATEARRTKDESRNLMSFSKAWKPGSILRVFYPIFETDDGSIDILVGADWMYPIDIKALKSLKRIAIPSKCKVNEQGRIIEPDLLYQFSFIASAILEGEKAKKKREILDTDDDIMDQELKQETLNSIDKEYENKQPAVGKRRYYISTECFVVPIVDDKPVVKEAMLYSQELSNSRTNALQAIIKNPQFVKHLDRGYIEVQYTMGTDSDKKVAGNVAPTGVTAEYALENTHPELFAQLKGQLSSLPITSNTIMKRNNSYEHVDDVDILKALKNYAVLNVRSINNITDESAINKLKKQAEIIEKLRLGKMVTIFNAAEELEAQEIKKDEGKEVEIIEEEIQDKTADSFGDDELGQSLADMESQLASEDDQAGF